MWGDPLNILASFLQPQQLGRRPCMEGNPRWNIPLIEILLRHSISACIYVLINSCTEFWEMSQGSDLCSGQPYPACWAGAWSGAGLSSLSLTYRDVSCSILGYGILQYHAQCRVHPQISLEGTRRTSADDSCFHVLCLGAPEDYCSRLAPTAHLCTIGDGFLVLQKTESLRCT